MITENSYPKADNHNPEDLNYQGEKLLTKGDKEGAEKAFKRALEIDPNFVTAHNNLGVLYWWIGDDEKSVTHFNQAMEIDPTNRDSILSDRLNRPKASIASASISHGIQWNSKENMNQWFSDSKAMKEYLAPERLRFYDAVVHLGNEMNIDYNGKHILDVGCGTGHLFLSLTRCFVPASLLGLDFSKAALKVAREVTRHISPPPYFYNFDIYDDSNLKADIIFCLEVLEHLLYPDKALRNLTDMMNRSATAILTVPNGRYDRWHGHINFWSPESWEIFIKDQCQGYDIKTGLIDNKNQDMFALINIS